MTVREAARVDLPAIRALQSLLPEPADDLFADGLPAGVTFVAVPDAPAASGVGADAPAASGVGVDSPATPVGYVHAYDTGYVSELAVAPAHEGAGHGRSLLARALAALRARGVDAAELEVAADNDRARSLYETLGFRVVDRQPDRYEDAGGLRMRVDLTGY